MVRRLFLFPITAALLVATPPVTQAQLYKWVDADGTVNYGDSPPKSAKDVRVLGKDAGNLTVVPGISAEQRDRLREREEQQRLQRLEREVEELRAREEARASAPPDVVYEEVYVPVYGGYWPGPGPRPRPPADRPGKPEHPIGKPRPEPPIAKPRPPDRTPPVEDTPPERRDPPGAMRRL